MEDQQYNDGVFYEEKKKLPTFLKVICILSFIGSSFGILGGGWGLISASGTTQEDLDAQIGMMEDLIDQGSPFASESIIQQIEITQENYLAIHGGTILLAILSFVGVLMMFRLRKTGFYLYVLACIGGHVLPFAWYGAEILFASSFAMGIQLVVMAITIAFILMYAVNLKHME